MKKGNELAIEENSGSIVIRNKRLEMVYDKSLCILVSLKVDGKSVLPMAGE